MAERRRVCVLLPGHWSAGMGGAQYQAKCIIDALLKSDRYEVAYVARNAAPDYRPDGYRLERIGNPLRVRRGHLYLDAPAINRTLDRFRPHVIYQRVGCAYAGIAARWARRNGARFVWQVAHDSEVEPFAGGFGRRSMGKLVDKKLLEYGIRHADGIVAQTRDQDRLLQSHYARRASAVVRNFHPAPRESIDKSGPLRVLWVANLKAFKRPELFIRLARELGHLTGVEFAMIGDLQGSAGWRADMREAMGAAPNLSYLGPRTQDEVNRELARAHLLVNTSTAEGFSNTFIQAWMRRVPVVTVGVNPDGLLDGGDRGYCCADFAALKVRVGSLLADPAGLERMGGGARAYALREHSERNAEKLMSILDGSPTQEVTRCRPSYT